MSNFKIPFNWKFKYHYGAFWQVHNYFAVDPNPDPDPEFRGRLDSGDGVLDLMLKPTLTTYESKEDEKKGDDDDD